MAALPAPPAASTCSARPMTRGPLHIDFETRSAVDLKKAGMYSYAEDPATEIILASYLLGDEPVKRRRGAISPDKVTDPIALGVKLTGRRAAREGACFIDSDNRTVGTVTSGTFSPTLQVPVAMGYLAAEVSAVGNTIDVDIRGSRASAEIVELPFYHR